MKQKDVEKLAIDKIIEFGISHLQAQMYYDSALKSQCINWRNWQGIES